MMEVYLSDTDLFRRVDYPRIVSELKHAEHGREYAVGEKECQTLERKKALDR